MTIGHNSGAEEPSIAARELIAFVERVERLAEERKGIGDDISDVYKEMKGRGFDVKAVKEVIRLRRIDHAERTEFEAIVDLYKTHIGMP